MITLLHKAELEKNWRPRECGSKWGQGNEEGKAKNTCLVALAKPVSANFYG